MKKTKQILRFGDALASDSGIERIDLSNLTTSTDDKDDLGDPKVFLLKFHCKCKDGYLGDQAAKQRA